jgi:hypothetical protein
VLSLMVMSIVSAIILFAEPLVRILGGNEYVQ